MGICWDGSVPSCCNDFRRRLVIGNVIDSSLEEIWQHEKFQAMRRKLYHEERDFIPCHGCNYRSYRNGLLPDLQGLDYLPEPTSKDSEILNEK